MRWKFWTSQEVRPEPIRTEECEAISLVFEGSRVIGAIFHSQSDFAFLGDPLKAPSIALQSAHAEFMHKRAQLKKALSS